MLEISRPGSPPPKSGRTWTGFLSIVWLVLVGSAVIYFHFTVPPFVAVPSSSMVPTLRVGDLAIVRPESAAQVRLHQIIVVDLPPSIQQLYHYPPSVIHRVVRIEHLHGQLQFRTKGDANPHQDPYTVLPSYVRGVVVYVLPGWGYPILFIHSVQGKAFLAATVVLIVANAIWSYGEKHRWSLRRGIRSMLYEPFWAELERRLPEALTPPSHSPPDLGEWVDALKAQTEILHDLTRQVEALDEKLDHAMAVWERAPAPKAAPEAPTPLPGPSTE